MINHAVGNADLHDGKIAQPGERPPDAREVMGSSPIVSISSAIERLRSFLLSFSRASSRHVEAEISCDGAAKIPS